MWFFEILKNRLFFWLKSEFALLLQAILSLGFLEYTDWL